MDDEDDTVLHEIDVFLTKQTDDELFIFQYPSKPVWRSFDQVVEAKIKPQQKKVELSFALDTKKASYDSDRGSQFAVNAGHSGTSSHFERTFMDRQVFQTTQTKHSLQKYFVGLLKQGQMHLSVVSAVLQLHSSFSYMDTDAEKKSENDPSIDEIPEAKPVTVKFARPETDRARKLRERSFSYFLNKLNQEAWVPLKYFAMESEFSKRKLSALLGRSDEPIANGGSASDEYVKTILAKLNANEKNALCNSRTSDIMQNKSLIDQIQALLLNVKLSHFNDVLRFLGKNVDQMAALRGLQHVAVLIHGCWIVKSEFLYPKTTTSTVTGVSAEVLCRARDLILWRFTQGEYVTRDSIASLIKLPHEDLKKMLSEIACYEPTKGWKLILPPDETFDRRFPEVMQRQKLLWDAKYLSLSKYFKQNDCDIGFHSPLRNRAMSHHSSDFDSDNQSFKRPSSSLYVHFKMEDDSSDNSAQATSTFESELSSFVSGRLAAYKVITISELRRHLNLKLSQSAPGHILCSGVSDSLLEATLKDIGAVCVSSTWPSIMTEEAIYALVVVNDGTESMRRGFIDLFRETCKLRKPAIKKNYEKTTGIPLSDDDFSILQKDYCTAPKKGCYYIKFSKF